jgi:hypothetical protein
MTDEKQVPRLAIAGAPAALGMTDKESEMTDEKQVPRLAVAGAPAALGMTKFQEIFRRHIGELALVAK